ncbi:alpha-1,2-mannosyltransferase [Amycolatopsis xylanica]|uniref:Alpha-1,2-mannosyltransferase n=1 Tax=Amycolatopsis xylanica TaxID=589385 RepID=A0A1H2YDH0_9PSEU|nr:glycosyltransferase 87 family protein [Amycolatopsis xylanica]SDX03071.1 alpha-1,2-mannosyltransferase [Amycolatopsis xylanica]
MSKKTLGTLLALEVAVIVAVFLLRGFPGLDLEVYVGGARKLAESGTPYEGMVVTTQNISLPFTYTPFAAVLFLAGTIAPVKAVLVVLNVLSLLGLGVVAFLCLVKTGVTRRTAAYVSVAVQLSATLVEPVLATLNYGQINILLMLAVVVDVLVPWRRWPRGVLVGLVAAIKLTPLVFCLFFLLRKDYRSLGRCVGTFAGVAAVMWAVLPSASERFWLHLMLATSRIGDLWYVGNQSFRGVLARAGYSGSLLWVLGVLVLLALTVFAIRAALRAGQVPLALVACAVGGLLVSPVSWTHHWVWCAPAVVLLGALGLRWRESDRLLGNGLLVFAGLSALLFVSYLPWLMPFPALTVGARTGAEAYTIAGVLMLATIWWASARRSGSAQLVDHELDALGEQRDVVRVDGREQADA